MSINWVMLAPNRKPPFHSLPDEVILHTTNNAVSLTIESGKELPSGDDRKKTFSSPSGTVYLTNQRIVYLPKDLSSMAEVQNFSVPIKRVSDSRLVQPWFSANAFVGTITPVKNGGIPHFAELKLVFNEGGAFEFYETYTSLLERLHAQEDTGVPVQHLEDLPRYSHDEPAPVNAPNGVGEGQEDAPPAYDSVAEEQSRGRTRERY